MTKIIHSKSTFVFFLCLILNLSAKAQPHKYFIITGKIFSDCEFIDQGAIHILKSNKPAVISEIPEHGRFRLELDYNSDYQLTFVQKGFLSKTIHVNTEIPEEINANPTNFHHFLMAVKLYKDNQDAANLYTGNLIQQINYSTEDKDFIRVPTIFDQEYVDRGNAHKSQSIRIQENKAKLNTYKNF